jgi:hypothetical protein
MPNTKRTYIGYICVLGMCRRGAEERTDPIRVRSRPPSTKLCVYISTYVVSKYNRKKNVPVGSGHDGPFPFPALTSDLSSHVQCGAVVVVMRCSGGRRSSFMVVVWLTMLGISGLDDFQVQLSRVSKRDR